MRCSAFAKLAPPLFQSSVDIRMHPETLALLCRCAVHEDWKLMGGRTAKSVWEKYRQRRIRWRRLSGQWMSSGSDWSRREPPVGGYGLKFKRLALQSFQGLLLSVEQGLAQREWPSRIHRKKRQGRPPDFADRESQRQQIDDLGESRAYLALTQHGYRIRHRIETYAARRACRNVCQSSDTCWTRRAIRSSGQAAVDGRARVSQPVRD